MSAPTSDDTADDYREVYEREAKTADGKRPITLAFLKWILHGIGTDTKAFVESKIEALTARLDALEAKPEIKYLGVWSAAESYPMGALTTHHGSIWHSNVHHNRAVPGEHPHWTLAVKRGRDGKDLR